MEEAKQIVVQLERGDSMKEYYRIGEISQMFEIEISTLRYYDKVDLFKPTKVDLQSGYRYYHISQFNILAQIRAYRSLDIPIKTLKEQLFHARPKEILAFIGDAEEQLKSHLIETQKKLKLLHSIQSGVQKAVELENNFATIMSPDFVVLAHDHEATNQTEEIFELLEKARAADPKRYTIANYFEVFAKDDFINHNRVRIAKGFATAERVKEELDYPILKGRRCLHCFIDVPADERSRRYQEVYAHIEKHRMQVMGNILKIHVMEYMYENRKISIDELYIPIVAEKQISS
jgi:DNA-binding transcriptional MerR regulator